MAAQPLPRQSLQMPAAQTVSAGYKNSCGDYTAMQVFTCRHASYRLHRKHTKAVQTRAAPYPCTVVLGCEALSSQVQSFCIPWVRHDDGFKKPKSFVMLAPPQQNR